MMRTAESRRDLYAPTGGSGTPIGSDADAPMHDLPPACLYRLKVLTETGPRFYQTSIPMRRLVDLELVVATGRASLEARSREYRITKAGRAELAERYKADQPRSLAMRRRVRAGPGLLLRRE